MVLNTWPAAATKARVERCRQQLEDVPMPAGLQVEHHREEDG
jgi:hypothetical protein